MRILLLCHEYPPIGGGAAAVCFALGKHYALNGHWVTVVTMKYRNLPEQERLNGTELFRIPCGRRLKERASPFEALLWSQKCWNMINRFHIKKPFDVAHAHFIMPAGIVTSRLKKAFGIPFIITPHGSDVPGYNRERLKFAHILVRPWWQRVCAHADYVVSPSASLLKLLSTATSKFNGKVIPNGFEPGRFMPLQKEKRILLCSRLVERKGFHYFLEAIEDLDLIGWEVDIVGDGPMYNRLAAMASRCRVPVHMHGWIDNDDPKLVELYGHALIFVFPSEWENFSIALLEAMSSGCAIVTTNISGNPEVIGEAGYLVSPGDAQALCSAIIELTSDANLCKSIGQRAAQRAADLFSWRVIARRYLKLLTCLAERKEHSSCVSV